MQRVSTEKKLSASETLLQNHPYLANCVIDPRQLNIFIADLNGYIYSRGEAYHDTVVTHEHPTSPQEAHTFTSSKMSITSLSWMSFYFRNNELSMARLRAARRLIDELQKLASDDAVANYMPTYKLIESAIAQNMNTEKICNERIGPSTSINSALKKSAFHRVLLQIMNDLDRLGTDFINSHEKKRPSDAAKPDTTAYQRPGRA